jgi:hypothetical protein
MLPWNIHTSGPNKSNWAVLNCSNWIRFHSLLVRITLSMLMFVLTPENCQTHLCHDLLTYLGHFVIYPSALWNTGVKAILDFSYYNNESVNQPLGNDALLTLIWMLCNVACNIRLPLWFINPLNAEGEIFRIETLYSCLNISWTETVK